MTPADILDAAADYIEVHGWRDDDQIGPNGERCALNAICVLQTADSRWSEALTRFSVHVGGLIGPWNDAQPNEYPVIDALRMCAKDLRNEAQP